MDTYQRSRTRQRSYLPRLALSAAFFHLSLMIAGAAHFPVGELPFVGLQLGIYSEVSGASNSYGFFSPGVFGQIRTVIEVTNQAGEKSTSPLSAGANREVFLRLNDVIDEFMNESKDPMKFQRSLAASLAGSIFAKRPDAAKVVVQIDQFTAPSRAQYVAGDRRDWVKRYSAKFVHRQGVAANARTEAP